VLDDLTTLPGKRRQNRLVELADQALSTAIPSTALPSPFT
jgi:hypothetical protein